MKKSLTHFLLPTYCHQNQLFFTFRGAIEYHSDLYIFEYLFATLPVFNHLSKRVASMLVELTERLDGGKCVFFFTTDAAREIIPRIIIHIHYNLICLQGGFVQEFFFFYSLHAWHSL